mmetsp:Transcript_27697/g.57650  ORF Transcript_27697/g.57650 Transcript_27697/m.57650 type:complete len:113 (+) Transcript_27697:256-594(+)
MLLRRTLMLPELWTRLLELARRQVLEQGFRDICVSQKITAKFNRSVSSVTLTPATVNENKYARTSKPIPTKHIQLFMLRLTHYSPSHQPSLVHIGSHVMLWVDATDRGTRKL